MGRGGDSGKRLKPGQPPGSVEPPDWAGEPPECEHGQKRRYKTLMKKNGEIGHLFECVAVEYPNSGQCDAQWLTPPKGNK